MLPLKSQYGAPQIRKIKANDKFCRGKKKKKTINRNKFDLEAASGVGEISR